MYSNYICVVLILLLTVMELLQLSLIETFNIVEDCDIYNYYLSLSQLIEMKMNDNTLHAIYTIFIAFSMRMCIF